MNRYVLATGAILIAIGFSVFLVKTGVYGLPLAPTASLGSWQVELRINVRGEGRRGSVRALLPTSVEGQAVFDERSSSGRLTFAIRDSDGTRVGVWTGWLEEIHEIVYDFRIQSYGVNVALPKGEVSEPPPSVRRKYGRPTPELPSSAPEVAALLEGLRLPRPEDVAARIRTLYAFVTHEIAGVPSAGRDALLTLAQREGSPEGKERLLVTLLRAAGVPARNMRGLELREGTDPETRIWSEAYVDGAWLPMSSSGDFFAMRPPNLVVLGEGELPLVEATGVRAVGHRYRSMQEHLRPEEIADMLAPTNPILAWLSLYRLPVPSQSALRVLLLLPIGALFVALFRNVIGIPTYGTFMPVLIALALRSFSLGLGLALVALVLFLGVLARLALERLRLLMVPRLSILLCLVVLTVTGLALVGRDSGNREFFAGLVFPIVILTMLVERFSITIAEEGLREAVVNTVCSVLVAVSVYPIFRSERAEYLMFSFPELVVAVMGVLVLIGGYTGYRVSDLIRFRSLVQQQTPGVGVR
jgi:transglutaminase-like putative cysteine protease